MLGVAPAKGLGLSQTAQPLIRPGGVQTRVKLSIFGDYVRGFARASQSAPDRAYIDGFAGGAKGIDPTTGEEYDGSAALSLGVEPPFTRVLLVEQDEGRAGLLRELVASQPNADVFQGDVNVEIPKLLRHVNPKAPTRLTDRVRPCDDSTAGFTAPARCRQSLGRTADPEAG